MFVVSLRAVEAGEGRRGLDGDDLGEGGAGDEVEDVCGEGRRSGWRGAGHWNMLLLGEGVNQVSIRVQGIACRSGKKEGGKEEDDWGRGWSGQLCSMNTNGYKKDIKMCRSKRDQSKILWQ